MTMVSRKKVRESLASLLSSSLSTIVQAVYDYGVASPGGQSPVVAITSAGSERTPSSALREPVPFSKLYFDIHVFVIYSARNSSGEISWSESDSEDSLDTVERAISETLRNNSSGSQLWVRIVLGKSSTDVLTFGGDMYRYERIPITVECYDE